MRDLNKVYPRFKQGRKAGNNTLGIMQPSLITLNEDGTVTGELDSSSTLIPMSAKLS